MDSPISVENIQFSLSEEMWTTVRVYDFQNRKLLNKIYCGIDDLLCGCQFTTDKDVGIPRVLVNDDKVKLSLHFTNVHLDKLKQCDAGSLVVNSSAG